MRCRPAERCASGDVATSAAGRARVVKVTDTGMGIRAEPPAAHLRSVLHDQGPGKGSGLGLATVFGIVAQHCGRVEVSSSVDHGTTFEVMFPVRTHAEGRGRGHPSPPKKSGPSRAAPKRSCSSMTNRRVRVSTRISAGARRPSACSRREARRPGALRSAYDGQNRPGFTDVVMPDGMNGLVPADRLLSLRPELPRDLHERLHPRTSPACALSLTDRSVVPAEAGQRLKEDAGARVRSRCLDRRQPDNRRLPDCLTTW